MNKIFSIFRKVRNSIKRIFLKGRAVAEDRGCWNCKHTNKSFEDLPCCWCDGPNLYEWEPEE